MNKPDKKDRKVENKKTGKGAKDEKQKNSLHAQTSKTPSPKLADSRSKAASKMANPQSPPKPPSSKPPNPSPGHPVGESKPAAPSTPKPPSSPPTPAKPSPSAKSSTAPSAPKPASAPHPDPSPGKPPSSAERGTTPSTVDLNDKDRDKDKGTEPTPKPASPTPSCTPPAPSPAELTPKPAGAPTPPSSAKEDAAAPKATPAPVPVAPATTPQTTDTHETPSSTTEETAAADAAPEKKREDRIVSIGWKLLIFFERSIVGKELVRGLFNSTHESSWYIWVVTMMLTTSEPSLKELLVNLFRGFIWITTICLLRKEVFEFHRPLNTEQLQPPIVFLPGFNFLIHPSERSAMTLLACLFQLANSAAGMEIMLPAFLFMLITTGDIALGEMNISNVLEGWAIGLIVFVASKSVWIPAAECDTFIRRCMKQLFAILQRIA